MKTVYSEFRINRGEKYLANQSIHCTLGIDWDVVLHINAHFMQSHYSKFITRAVVLQKSNIEM